MDIVSYLLGKNSSKGGNTGVEIESGSNEYGNYMKYSTGDLIQWGILIVEANHAYVDVNLPVAFKDTDYLIMANSLTAGASYGGSSAIQTFVSPQKDTASLAYIYSYPSSGSTALSFDRKVCWIAIGKWK